MAGREVSRPAEAVLVWVWVRVAFSRETRGEGREVEGEDGEEGGRVNLCLGSASRRVVGNVLNGSVIGVLCVYNDTKGWKKEKPSSAETKRKACSF